LGLIPVLEGADRDLLLQQRSRSRGGEAAQPQFTLRTRASDPPLQHSWQAVGFGTPL
jgi:hypothetical protein